MVLTSRLMSLTCKNKLLQTANVLAPIAISTPMVNGWLYDTVLGVMTFEFLTVDSFSNSKLP